MKTLLLVAALCLAIGGVGCIAAPVVPPLGVVYSDVDAPISLKGQFGSRTGRAHVVSLLGLVSTGDGSVRAAARNGNIRDVKHVDYEFYNVLGLYQRYTTVAYGD